MAEVYPSYVEIPVLCNPKIINNTNYRTRHILTAKFNNSCSKHMTYILMNPSHATENESDITVNKCAFHAYSDLKHLEIGSFTIVNVHPFYEPDSNNLHLILDDLQTNFPVEYSSAMKENMNVIKQTIVNTDVIFLCTGNVPKSVTDKKTYRSIVRSIHKYIESNDKSIYLCKGDRNPTYYGKGNISHHLSPRFGEVNKANLHRIRNSRFIEVASEEIILSKYVKEKKLGYIKDKG